MKTKCIIIDGKQNIKITDSALWKDFESRLNNPAPEAKEARRRFFEECDKLIITNEDDHIKVEADELNTEEILKCYVEVKTC